MYFKHLCLIWCLCAWVSSAYEVISFNADLIHPDNYVSCKRTLMDQLLTSSADVVCLQGVLSEMDIREIIDVTAQTFPFSWSFLHTAEGILETQADDPYNPCELETVVDFCVCVDNNCRQVANNRDTYFGCIFDQCQPLATFTPRCMECLVDACFEPTDLGATFGCMLNSTQPSATYCQTYLEPPAVTSTKGLLLISKLPLDPMARGSPLDSRTVMPVGYLTAAIDPLGEIVCTHLTGFLGEPFMDGQTGFTSYEEENNYETGSLLDRFNTVDGIIMGDLNFGPDLPNANISGQFVSSYGLMEDSGFFSASAANGQCTVCADNPLAGPLLTRNGDNYILDHLIFKEGTELIIEDVQVLYYGLEDDIPDDSLPLSSHYAVRALVSASES